MAEHAGVVRERIHQLKFGGQLHGVPPLAELPVRLAGREAAALSADMVCPVPFHIRRLRQRGFSQAGLLARIFGSQLDLPVRCHSLVRRCWTEPQTRLNREERLHNVRDAFLVTNPGAVKRRRILLVHDVFTTGTTLSECAKTLKAARAASVQAITVSRAAPEGRSDFEAKSDRGRDGI